MKFIWVTLLDKDGYRRYLTNREQPIPEKEIVEATNLVELFEKFLKQFDKTLKTATSVEVQQFSKILIKDRINTYNSYVALSRYAYFVKNMDLYLAVLELLDGAEVMDVLYERLSENVDDERRDKILPKQKLPPLGLPSSEKVDVTREVMAKMEKFLDSETCKKTLVAVAHGLPRNFRKGEREKYLNSDGIDDYLKRKRESVMAELQKHRDESTLFYNQEITDEVLEFLRSHPDILVGERRDDVIYHTKIPYITKEYLEETDEQMKRYYACHCAWARESIKTGNERISPTFCYCSAGFTKMPWEAALDQSLEVEMVKSVLKGDLECSFIIHLPKDVVVKEREYDI
jgi:hypothetical protein